MRAGCVLILLVTACKRTAAPAPRLRLSWRSRRCSSETCPSTASGSRTLDGYVNARIQSRVTGYLLTQHFKEGSFVHRNEVLFEIDARPFRRRARSGQRATR